MALRDVDVGREVGTAVLLRPLNRGRHVASTRVLTSVGRHCLAVGAGMCWGLGAYLKR
jgi:hypothetical protein